MKLVVISSLEHYRAAGGFACGSAAAAREIDALAPSFDQVVHVACLHGGDAPAQARPYRASNLRLELLPPAGGPGFAGKLDALLALRGRLGAVRRCWLEADAALVRCPSNVAAAALLLMTAGARPARVWIKYTGPWQGREGEAWGYRFQRLWLRSGLTGAAVSVGGIDPAPGGGARTVCNPSLALADVQAAEAATRAKSLTVPWRLLAVGRLVEDKGLDLALQAAAVLALVGYPVELDIAGDGPARQALENLASSLGIRSRVRFHGWLGTAALEPLYRRSHLLLAPSLAEGCSRAWTEAAAWRCVPVASAAGAARGLESAGAGLVIGTRDPAVWALEIRRLLENERRWLALAAHGPVLARSFTYERFLEQARVLLGLDSEGCAAEVFKIA